MKKLLTIIFFSFWLSFAWAQITVEPAFFTADMTGVKIIYDATQGTSGLEGASSVHIHTGVILSGPTGTGWENVPTEWGNPNSPGQMIRVSGETNKWEFTFPGTIREFYGVANGVDIYRLGLVFRESGPCGDFNGNSNPCAEGKDQNNADIFVDLFQGGLELNFTDPANDGFFADNGEMVNISVSTSVAANISLEVNGVEVTSVTNMTTASTTINVNENFYKVIARATNGEASVVDSISFLRRQAAPVVDLPVGVQAGINEIDANTVTLVLQAPEKKFVYILGEMNDWELNPDYLLNKNTDGNFHWITLDNLTPGQEYAFQYAVYDLNENLVKAADPYSEKLLFDSDTDPRVANNYPNLKSFPQGKTSGAVSVFQTNQAAFNFEPFTRPAKEDLLIYELLVRDFDTPKNFQAVIDRLGYLEELGVNAIELMPVMEFSGNESWGYNPIFFFAVDKSYGTEAKLKELINEAHKRGIAVILDMVLNHADFECPLAKMYFENGQPTANNPWFNQQARHPFNVFYDFNHESQATQDFIDRVNAYWLTEYKFDGYRFDLSKGFTQNDDCGGNADDVGCWNNYDASRVAILKRMADAIWAVDPDAYVMLEHLGVDQEEIELANYRADEGKGMMPWGIMHQSYKQASLGFSADSDISRTYAKNRQFAGQTYDKNILISYMESHDEERLMYENAQFGNSADGYDVKDLNTSLERIKAAATLFFSVPGAKMLWQFGELGYDVSINDGGRLGEKPIRWNYFDDPERLKLYKVFSELMHLRDTSAIYKTDHVSITSGNSLLKEITLLPTSLGVLGPENIDEMTVYVVANMGVTKQNLQATFPHPAIWYDYFAGGAELNINIINTSLNLLPGEFRVFTNINLAASESNLTDFTTPIPTPPATFVAVAEGFNRVELSWKDNSDNESVFTIYRATNENGPYEAIASVAANTTSYTDQTGLLPETQYYYKVAAANADGTEIESNTFPATTLTSVENTQLTRAITVYPNPGKDDFRVEFSQKPFQTLDVRVLDIRGKEVKYINLPDQFSGNTLGLPLKGLQKGFYILQFISDRGVTQKKLLIE